MAEEPLPAWRAMPHSSTPVSELLRPATSVCTQDSLTHHAQQRADEEDEWRAEGSGFFLQKRLKHVCPVIILSFSDINITFRTKNEGM